jgi:serine/threonine protein kinase
MSAGHPAFDDLHELGVKYEVLGILGDGGMGRVLRARHRQLKELVAIKLLLHDANLTGSRERFLREARAAAKIRSPHAPRIMDTGVLGSGQPYIVMEYLDGQDLARMVADQGPLECERAIEFVLQALEALAEAHAGGIIHRDIKPGNLFATFLAGGEVCIKVLDFGLAKTNGNFETVDPCLTERGAVLGTPSYMAPEQFVNAQDVDVRADIWALGASLFELLTGEPPFQGATLPQLYTAVVHAPIKRLHSVMPTLPDGLDAAIDRCLSRQRSSRFGNVAELARALEPFGGLAARYRVERIARIVGVAGAPASDAPICATSANVGEATEVAAKSSKPSIVVPRHRTAQIVVVLTSIALLAATAWAMLGDSNHSPPRAAPTSRHFVSSPSQPVLPPTNRDTALTSSSASPGATTTSNMNAEPKAPSAAQFHRRPRNRSTSSAPAVSDVLKPAATGYEKYP